MSNLYLPKTKLPIEQVLKDSVRNSFLKKYRDCNICEYEAKFNYKSSYSYYLILKSIVYFLWYFRNTKKILEYQIEGINLGLVAYSTTLRNFRVYQSKLFLILRLLIQFILSTIEYISAINIAKDAQAVYVRDISYRKGILYDVCMKQNVGVYLNRYPFGLVFCKNRKFTSRNYGKNPFPKIRVLDKDYYEYMAKRIDSPHEFIPYYDPANDSEEKSGIDMIDLNKHKTVVLVYAHSFTDAQMAFGYDGFTNVDEWLCFTLDELIKKNIHVIVKAHPNFWAEGFSSNLVEWDKKIWETVLEKYNNIECIDFINFPINNCDLLNKMDKDKTIVVSKHGNAIVEAAFLGFRGISSEASPWGDEYYAFCETWHSKEEYMDLLNNINLCSFPEIDKLKNFVSDRYMYEYGYHGDFVWYVQLANEIGVKPGDLVKKPSIVSMDKFKNYENIINKISMNIKEVGYLK